MKRFAQLFFASAGYIFVATLMIQSSVTQASEKVPVDDRTREEILSRAQVWHPVNIGEQDLLHGPQDKVIHDNDTINCTYIDMRSHPLHGGTPKFQCQTSDGKIHKIKYGKTNGEVYGSVVSSRLLWALGFGADHVIPVQVVCNGCSQDPWANRVPQPGKISTFKEAVIIAKTRGVILVRPSDDYSGVAWSELSKIRSDLGGAPKGHTDALKLMASLIEHVDSKPENQTLVCQDKDYEETKVCAHPLVYMHDVGTTFSLAQPMFGFAKFNLEKYRKAPLWKNSNRCITALRHGSAFPNMMSNPRISEAGRKFLSDLLLQLSHQQIVDAFTAANVQNFNAKYTPEAWASALEEKIEQITSHPACNEN